MVAAVVAGKDRMGNELSLEGRYAQTANMGLCSEEDEGREGRQDRGDDRRELEEGNQGWKLAVVVDVPVYVHVHVVAEVVVLETVLVLGEVSVLLMVQDQGLAAGLEEHEPVRDLELGLGVATVPVREQYPGWSLED